MIRILNQLFLLIIFLGLQVGCFASSYQERSDQNKAVLQFSNLDRQHSLSKRQPISFSVENVTKKSLSYYCSVQEKSDDWYEVVPSILADKIRKSVKMTKIAPGEIQNIVWDKDSQPFYPTSNYGMFRFVIIAFDDKNRMVIYSEPFEIMK